MSNLLSSMRARYENLRTVAFGSITSSYTQVGAAFENPVRIIKIINGTNENILISFDGVETKDVALASGGHVIDYSSNQADQAGVLEQPAGQAVWIKAEGSLPSSGSVYVTTIYAAQR